MESAVYWTLASTCRNSPWGLCGLEAVEPPEGLRVRGAAGRARTSAIGVADKAAFRIAGQDVIDVIQRARSGDSPRGLSLGGLDAMESAERSRVGGAWDHTVVPVVRSGIAYDPFIENRVAREGNGSGKNGRDENGEDGVE